MVERVVFVLQILVVLLPVTAPCVWKKMASPDADEYSNGPQEYDWNVFWTPELTHVFMRSSMFASVTIVALVSEFTVKLRTGMFLIETEDMFQKPVPVTFTVVPPTNEPCVTSKDVTDITGQYVHKDEPVALVYEDVTATFPVPLEVPAPVTTVI
jgi:hypothetical protein